MDLYQNRDTPPITGGFASVFVATPPAFISESVDSAVNNNFTHCKHFS